MKRLALLLTALLLAPASLALAQATYTTIDFPGASSTVATGIDTAGDIVGGFRDSAGFSHGFLLSNGVYTQLDAPGTTQGTAAYGINDVGQIVGSTGASGLGLFVYDIPTQTYTFYQYSKGGYGLATTATGINNAGVVVGYTEGSGGTIGLELRGSTFKPVSIPGATFTQLTSINDAGAIIAVATAKSGSQSSYLLQGNGNLTQITIPDQPTAVAVAINDSNVLAGDYVRSVRNSAFEWQRKGLFKPITEPTQPNTFAFGINNAGQVVGYYLDSGVNAHGYLWTPPAVDKK